MNHDTSYLRTTYARDKMIEEYNNDEKKPDRGTRTLDTITSSANAEIAPIPVIKK